MADVKALREAIGWSRPELSKRLGVSMRALERWENGQNPAPDEVVAWLALLAAFHAAHARPEGWEK
jgi:transcriptional regulator with XRE-family HTH domain